MRLWPQSLFGRTAVLIASTLLVFSVIAWQVMVWTVIAPTAQLTVQILTERAHAAVAARRAGRPLPADAHFEPPDAAADPGRLRGFAFASYMESIRTQLQSALGASEVRITRLAAPSEIWVRMPQVPDAWLVMSWRIAGPRAPLAALVMLAAAAVIVLGGAAWSAQRLTAPLAALSAAAARVAAGERVAIDEVPGPSEVRSLARAFDSMSQRLAELDEQRELMLAGISHDLRTPLARVRVAIELLETRDAALIDEMTASVEEIDRMIGQFLHYVRANYRERPTLASLDQIVRQVLAANGAIDQVDMQLQAPEPRCFAVECMRHSALNLLQNAFEYGLPPVSVRTSATAETIELHVSDRGAGMSGAAWLEALRPFERLQPQPSGGHTGLGLALVDRLVRVCGGELQSAAVDGVFTISVRLPVAAAEPARA